MEKIREFHHFQLRNGIDCLLAESALFKTVTMQVVFTLPLSKFDAPQQAMLPGLLSRSCAKHPGLAALTRYCEELYGTTIRARARKVGQQHVLSISLATPAAKYVPNGDAHLQRVFELAYELIANPRIERPYGMKSGHFPREVFISQQEQLLRSIESEINDKGSYALRHALEANFAGSAYGIPETGGARAPLMVDNQGAFRRYTEMLRAAPLAIYVNGPIDVKRVGKQLAKIFEKIERVPQAQQIPVKLNKAARHWPKMRKSMDYAQMEQSFLVLSHTTGANIAHRDFPALRFADAIFGRLSTSRLFRVIREDEGLAYSVASSLSETTGLNLAWVGCDLEKLPRASQLVKRELKRLKTKGFDDAEFESARASLLTELSLEQDQHGARIASLIVQQSVGKLITHDQQLEAMRKVTPEQVQRAFQRFTPRLEYRLEPL